MELANENSNTQLPLVLVDDTGNAVNIEIRPDGYINATKLCQAMGKEWKNYYNNAKTKEFLAELSKVEKISVEIRPVGPTGQIASRTGTGALVHIGISRTQNTWIQPDVAINLAQWASPRFGVAVSRLVRRYQTGQVSTEESIAASRVLAGHISLVDSAEVEKHRIDAHAKLELEKYKYRIDAEITAKLETDKHNLSCDMGNTQYFRKLDHEKEMAEMAARHRMESLERERQLLLEFGYPMRTLPVKQWLVEFLTQSPGSSISLNDAMKHFNQMSGRALLKKEFRMELSNAGVTVLPITQRMRIVDGIRGWKFKD